MIKATSLNSNRPGRQGLSKGRKARVQHEGPEGRSATVNRGGCTCWILNLRSFHKRTREQATVFQTHMDTPLSVVDKTHSQHQHNMRYGFPPDRTMDTGKKSLLTERQKK